MPAAAAADNFVRYVRIDKALYNFAHFIIILHRFYLCSLSMLSVNSQYLLKLWAVSDLLWCFILPGLCKNLSWLFCKLKLLNCEKHSTYVKISVRLLLGQDWESCVTKAQNIVSFSVSSCVKRTFLFVAKWTLSILISTEWLIIVFHFHTAHYTGVNVSRYSSSLLSNIVILHSEFYPEGKLTHCGRITQQQHGPENETGGIGR